MNQKQQDIITIVLWIFCVVIVVSSIFALYATFGTSAPYHKKIFPGLSTQPIETMAETGQLSASAMVAYHYAEKIMELLDLGIPVFAILVFHHLLMNFRTLMKEKGAKFYE
ncbi:MAG: hypothetical protein M8352_03835 [ANME-2 cluster archaeon]|nr:hypothetical protein [ANME-2 cluster archaeon]